MSWWLSSIRNKSMIATDRDNVLPKKWKIWMCMIIAIDHARHHIPLKVERKQICFPKYSLLNWVQTLWMHNDCWTSISHSYTCQPTRVKTTAELGVVNLNKDVGVHWHIWGKCVYISRPMQIRAWLTIEETDLLARNIPRLSIDLLMLIYCMYL